MNFTEKHSIDKETVKTFIGGSLITLGTYGAIQTEDLLLTGVAIGATALGTHMWHTYEDKALFLGAAVSGAGLLAYNHSETAMQTLKNGTTFACGVAAIAAVVAVPKLIKIINSKYSERDR